MSKRNYLGEFEQLVLLALLRLEDDGYGLAVRREIEQRTERIVGIGSVYATLDRLESKGLVDHHVLPPTSKRGGRAKKAFRLTRNGRAALARTREMVARMSHGLTLDTGQGGK